MPLLFLGPASLLADGFFRPPGGVDLVRLDPLLLREDGAEGDDDLGAVRLGADRLDDPRPHRRVRFLRDERDGGAFRQDHPREEDLLLLVGLGSPSR